METSQKDTLSQSPRVFICYAREDLDMAQQLHDDLERAGVSPWIDQEDLLPGHKWELIIEQAIQSSSFVLVLLSQTSVSKRGFVHKEIRQAVSLLDEFPDSAIFIIPVRLEACQPPRQLEGLQWVDLFPDYQAGLTELLKVLAPEGRNELLRRKIQMLSDELARLEQKRDIETDSKQIRRLQEKTTADRGAVRESAKTRSTLPLRISSIF